MQEILIRRFVDCPEAETVLSGGVLLLHMTAADYEKSRSLEVISPRRLKILEKIVDEQLMETAEAIKVEKMAGYQENMWKVYLEDLMAADTVF